MHYPGIRSLLTECLKHKQKIDLSKTILKNVGYIVIHSCLNDHSDSNPRPFSL